MTTLDEEDVVEEGCDTREAPGALQWNLQTRRIFHQPLTPFGAFVVGVVEEAVEWDGDAHGPRRSTTDMVFTVPSFNARMPGSMILRSPTTTTLNLPG